MNVEEDWKPIKEFPYCYVSNFGSVRNFASVHVYVPVKLNEDDYPIVELYNKSGKHSVEIHNLVADAFLPEKPNSKVYHKDENTHNNYVGNLRRVPLSEDGQLFSTGKRNQKLTADQAITIFLRSQIEGTPMWAIAEEYNVSINTIWAIKERKTYKETTFPFAKKMGLIHQEQNTNVYE